MISKKWTQLQVWFLCLMCGVVAVGQGTCQQPHQWNGRLQICPSVRKLIVTKFSVVLICERWKGRHCGVSTIVMETVSRF